MGMETDGNVVEQSTMTDGWARGGQTGPGPAGRGGYPRFGAGKGRVLNFKTQNGAGRGGYKKLAGRGGSRNKRERPPARPVSSKNNWFYPHFSLLSSHILRVTHFSFFPTQSLIPTRSHCPSFVCRRHHQLRPPLPSSAPSAAAIISSVRRRHIRPRSREAEIVSSFFFHSIYSEFLCFMWL
ncbi:hypothetical protein COP2_002708 [Malus domestica]